MTLTPERIAQYRKCISAELPDWVPVHKSDLLALLDAYEAARPRTASEVPPLRERVLVEYGYGDNPLVSTGYYSGGPMPWHIDRSGRFPDEAVHRWWTLPNGGDK